MSILVIALEGIHGVGKTTKMKKFYKEKTSKPLICMDEAFIPKVKSHFHPQSFYLESVWATKWFQRLEKICSPYFDTKTQKFQGDIVVIADRSPYSACVYAIDGDTHVLSLKIDENVKQFKEKGINIKICYLEDEKDVILKRIKKRLKEEEWRKMLKEDDEERFDFLLEKYKNFMSMCVNIKGDTTLKELIKLL